MSPKLQDPKPPLQWILFSDSYNPCCFPPPSMSTMQGIMAKYEIWAGFYANGMARKAAMALCEKMPFVGAIIYLRTYLSGFPLDGGPYTHNEPPPH